MARRWLHIPSADRDKARTLVQWVDWVLGYPAMISPGERGYRNVGRGRHVDSVPAETQVVVVEHDDTGATALHGAIAITVLGVEDGLRDRVVDVDGTRRTIGGLVQHAIANWGWVLQEGLAGQRAAWSLLAVRMGQEGSTTGEPIPEGEE